MPELWTAPETFDPERFNAERREDRSHRYAWEPFGGGVHKCLGMYFAGAEVKAFLFRFLQDFDWSVDPSYVDAMHEREKSVSTRPGSARSAASRPACASAPSWPRHWSATPS